MCNNAFINNVKAFNRYYMPIIIILGLTGNMLSIMVFMSTKLKRIPSSHCLTAMAVVDCSILLINSFHLLGGISLLQKNFWCQISQYVSSVLYFLSVWFVVSFTVERFVAVLFPLHRLRWCTVNRCRLIIICLVALSCTWNIYIVAITKPITFAATNETHCTSPEELFNVMMALNYIDTVITFVFPFLLIVIFNSLISVKLIKNRKENETPPPSTTLSSSDGRVLISTESRRHSSKCFMKKDEKITKVLLLVSFVFLIMIMPDHVLRLIMSALHQSETWKTMSPTSICIFLQVQQIANIIFNTNFAVNFFLYNLAGKNFRRHVKELFRSFFRCIFIKKRISTKFSNLRNRGDYLNESKLSATLIETTM